MQIHDMNIPGVKLIIPTRHGDNRGFFAETWNQRAMAAHGIDTDFVQDNHSLSAEPGTVRGLHFQAPPHAQAKLVRCGRGRLFDVAVDVRRGSPTFGRWTGAELSYENGWQLLIPAGFLHGFVTREPDTEIVYKCSTFYAPDHEGAVRWNDPQIGIDWGISPEDAILSRRDAEAVPLSDFWSPFEIEEKAA